MALDVFKKKVESISEKYADMVEQSLDAKIKAGKTSYEDLREINEGIRLLNYIANTMERIDRLQFQSANGHEEHGKQIITYDHERPKIVEK